ASGKGIVIIYAIQAPGAPGLQPAGQLPVSLVKEWPCQMVCTRNHVSARFQVLDDRRPGIDGVLYVPGEFTRVLVVSLEAKLVCALPELRCVYGCLEGIVSFFDNRWIHALGTNQAKNAGRNQIISRLDQRGRAFKTLHALLG